MFGFIIWVTGLVLRRHKIIGAENIDKESGAVFVCNHAGAYGPVAMMVFFPFEFKPWVLYCSTFRKLCRKQLEPACLWVMRNVHAIPVYRGRNEIFRTFSLSMEALKSGSNIVLFPENTVMKLTLQLQDFNSGFVHLARKYYRLTGKSLSFHPVYINKKRRAIVIGEPVVYKPGTDFKQEKLRVKDELHKSMRIFAGQ